MIFTKHKRTAALERQIESLEGERDSLTDRNRMLKDNLAELEQKHRMQDEDIKHLVKIKESKLQMEHDQKMLVMQREKDADVLKIKDAYRDKLEAFLQQQVKDIKEMYGEILGRMPNVNVRLKGDV